MMDTLGLAALTIGTAEAQCVCLSRLIHLLQRRDLCKRAATPALTRSDLDPMKSTFILTSEWTKMLKACFNSRQHSDPRFINLSWLAILWEQRMYSSHHRIQALMCWLVMTLFDGTSRASGGYELQVYITETLRQYHLMVELHSNDQVAAQRRKRRELSKDLLARSFEHFVNCLPDFEPEQTHIQGRMPVKAVPALVAMVLQGDRFERDCGANYFAASGIDITLPI
jgi:hypothetical protein